MALMKLEGRRGWVVKEPWFLVLHDVYHVGLSLDDGTHAEVERDWCCVLDAIDRLAEVRFPPPPARPWPPPNVCSFCTVAPRAWGEFCRFCWLTTALSRVYEYVRFGGRRG